MRDFFYCRENFPLTACQFRRENFCDFTTIERRQHLPTTADNRYDRLRRRKFFRQRQQRREFKERHIARDRQRPIGSDSRKTVRNARHRARLANFVDQNFRAVSVRQNFQRRQLFFDAQKFFGEFDCRRLEQNFFEHADAADLNKSLVDAEP